MRIFWGKRTGRYELSQDIFVLSVFVNDPHYPLAQCTLNADSSVRDCFDFLRQKINLRQSECFGLRYQMKCNDPDIRFWRWVEFDRPLKKQLDKFACKPRQVQLAVLFHTPNCYALQDGTARSLYYALMKLDVLSGKHIMEVEKYVNLAALSLQIEFGDYEPTEHTLDLLRSLNLLPPQLAKSIQFWDDFLLRILTAYERHSGKDMNMAAVQYIEEVMQSEAYGEELFNAKDDEATEVRLGYRLDSVIVRRFHRPMLRFPFADIREISTAKRSIAFKCTDGTTTIFMMEDAELAKYVCQLLVLQARFSKSEAAMHLAVPRNLRHFASAMWNSVAMGAVGGRISDGSSTQTSNSTDLGTGSSVCSNCPPCTSASLLGRTSSIPFVNGSVHGSQLVMQQRGVPRLGSNNSDGVGPLTIMTPLPPSSSTPSLPHVAAFSPGKPPPAPQTLFDARDAEHRILRQLLAEKKARKIGSSPEIHTITSNARYTSNCSNVSRLPVNGVGRRLNGRFQAHETLSASLSTPDLFLKCHSTPNLIHSVGPFSFGRVISSSTQRPLGQPITYPVPSTALSSRQMSNASGVQITGMHAADPLRVVGLAPPPLENLQSFLATLRPPLDSPCDSLSENRTRSIDENYSPVSTPSSGGLPDRPQLSFDSVGGTPSGSMQAVSRHVLVNGVVLNGRPDFLKPIGDGRRASKTGNCENGKLEVRNAEDVIQLLSTKLANSQTLEMEFATIPQKRLSAGASTSQCFENQCRNRSKSVLPYEDTRVMLHPTRRNPDGYINASNVQVPIGERLFRYVLTQLPLKNTTEDFWQMVWESGSRVVVAMTSGKPDELTYLPSRPTEKVTVGDFVIRQQSCSATKSLITTIMVIKSTSGGEKRTIYHLNFTGFRPEDGVPISTDLFLGFIDAVNSVKRHIDNERVRDADSGVFVSSSTNASRQNSRNRNRSRSVSRVSLMDVTNRIRNHSVENNWRRKLTFGSSGPRSTSSSHSDSSTSSASGLGGSGTAFRPDVTLEQQPPILVTCVDGAADSGLFVLVELIVHCIENNVQVEVAKLLKLLRQQRASLIRSPGQYRFVYESILAYLQRSRLI